MARIKTTAYEEAASDLKEIYDELIQKRASFQKY